MKTKVEEFRDWIKEANVGQTYIYYQGRLDIDRGSCVGDLWLSNYSVDELGKLAYDAFTSKKLHLFQRKLHDNEYQYIAMKRSPYGRTW